MKKYICLGLLCFTILCGCHSLPSDTLMIQNNATTPLYGFHIHCIAHDKTIEDHVIINADQSYFNEKTNLDLLITIIESIFIPMIISYFIFGYIHHNNIFSILSIQA